MNAVHRTLTHIRLWDWTSAEAALRELLGLADLPQQISYSSKVYLGSCYLHGQFNLDMADRHLRETIIELEGTKFGVLQRSARLLRAQALCLKGEFEESERLLLEVRDHAEKRRAQDAFEIAGKWLAILGLRRDGLKKVHLDRLAHARDQLARINRWERVRGCDYYLALINRDPELIARLRVGTPYPAFQDRLDRMFGQAGASEYHWEVPSLSKLREIAPKTFDPYTLKPGQLRQRLILALASDFYRPFKLVELHELVFPGEHFNPHSSVLKIHQAMSRLRTWLKEENIPLDIQVKRETYSLIATAPCQLILPIGKRARPQARPVIVEAVEALKEKVQGEFGIQEAMTILGAPRRSAVRYLAEAQEFGLLEKHGKGKSTRYTLKEE